jgi:hypothetical protein
MSPDYGSRRNSPVRESSPARYRQSHSSAGQDHRALRQELGQTFMYLGIIFAVLSSFMALMVYLFTWERPREEIGASRQKFRRPVQAVGSCSGRWAPSHSAVRHLGMYIGGYISRTSSTRLSLASPLALLAPW